MPKSSLTEIAQHYQKPAFLGDRIAIHQYGDNPTPFWEWVLNHYAFKPDQTILDIGCGRGEFWRYAETKLSESVNITLSDISSAMIDMVKQQFGSDKRFQFQVADICELPFTKNSFDACIAHFMFYHTDNKIKAIEEVTRVLKTNGWLGLIVSAEEARKELFAIAHALEPTIPLMGKDSDSFNDKIASEFLPKYFNSVKSYRYTNTLHIPDDKPILSFMRSHPFIQKFNLNEEFFVRYSELIKEKIHANGVFSISSDSVLFICER